jgi:peptide/nickel transport system permease protein
MIHGQKSSYRLIPIENFEFEKELVIVEEYAEYTDKPFVKTFHVADVVYPVMIDEKILIMGDTLVFKDINNKLHEANLSSLQERITRGHVIEKKFPLGTDRFGRDLLSRLIIGTRISIAVGMISVTISLLIGIWLGAAAGYFGGRVDNTIMWLINVVWSIPTLLMVIAITLVLGKGFWQVFVAVGLTMWVEVARVVRGQVLSVKEKEYIEAARVLGFSHARIIFHHILPNVINPVIIISAANFATAILIESGLSFLGIGVQPPVPSWGNMIKDHYGYIIVDLAYLAILPGLAIMLMVLSFTLVGNGLRDALDVKGNK